MLGTLFSELSEKGRMTRFHSGGYVKPRLHPYQRQSLFDMGMRYTQPAVTNDMRQMVEDIRAEELRQIKTGAKPVRIVINFATIGDGLK